MEFPPWKLPSGFCLPDVYPWIASPWQLPSENYPYQVSLWTTYEKCFTKCFKYKLRISEVSIATAHSSTGGHCKPLSRALDIFYIFHWYCVIESLNLNKLCLALKLFLAAVTANYQKHFKHVCLKLTSHRVLHYLCSVGTFLNIDSLCQYLSFLNIISIDFARWKKLFSIDFVKR